MGFLGWLAVLALPLVVFGAMTTTARSLAEVRPSAVTREEIPHSMLARKAHELGARLRQFQRQARHGARFGHSLEQMRIRSHLVLETRHDLRHGGRVFADDLSDPPRPESHPAQCEVQSTARFLYPHGPVTIPEVPRLREDLDFPNAPHVRYGPQHRSDLGIGRALGKVDDLGGLQPTRPALRLLP